MNHFIVEILLKLSNKYLLKTGKKETNRVLFYKIWGYFLKIMTVGFVCKLLFYRVFLLLLRERLGAL